MIPARCRLLSPQDLARFWAKVDRRGTAHDCWEWKATRSQRGYGRFWFNGHLHHANRISWVIAHGPIPDGMFVCHRCDNPPCVNPAHLFLGTPTDNAQDSIGKGRFTRARGDDHGARRHPDRLARGERSGGSKLTESEVLEIRRQYAQTGERHADIAARFGVTRCTVSSAIRGKTWAHVAS